jgi:antitoxin PrlF
MKRYLMAFAATLVSLCVLNFLFHQVLAADFFDRELQGKVLPVRQLSPLWPAVIYAMSALAMVAFAARGPATARPWRAAVLGGGFVGLLTFGTWNLMNYAWLPGWPLSVVLVDTSWHVVCGLISGGVLARWLPSMTSEGQVTAPKQPRDNLSLEPGAEVEFELRPEGDVAVRPARCGGARQRGPGRFVERRGTLKTGMTTDEMMRLLRGYDEDAKDPGLL